MNIEAVEDIVVAKPGSDWGGFTTGISWTLAAALAAEIALALLLAAACYKLLRTPKSPLSSERGVKTRLVWIDKSGRVIESSDLEGRYTSPRTSRGRSSVLLNKIEPSRIGIWSFSSVGHALRAVTSSRVRAGFGVLSPDNKDIVFQHWGEGLVISEMKSARSKSRRLVSDIGGIAEDWSPDGRFIAFIQRKASIQGLWLFEVSSRVSRLFLKAEEVAEARFSPDGQWIAFCADFGSGDAIYLARIPLDSAPSAYKHELIRVSEQGGHSPRWGSSANQLFYVSDGEALLMVELQTGSSIPVQTTKMFDIREKAGREYEYRFDGYGFDYTRDAFVFALAPAARFSE